MEVLQIDVVVPSGRSALVSISPDAQVCDLQIAAQKELKLGPFLTWVSFVVLFSTGELVQ